MKFPKHKYILTICLSILALTACVDHQQKEIDLSGKWSFKIDSTDVGETEYWFTKQLDEVIQLPGSMAENGKGNDITVNTNWTGNMWNDSLWYKDPKMAKYRKEGNVKVPFWLTPVKDYKGAAWYQKTITIPENWKNKKIKARFICALSICYLDKKIASVLGKVEGYISTKPKGKNGFGYDPIFIPKNKRKTFGEMSSLQKYKIDHRFAAFKKIRKFL